jgi:hypothetical protein
MVILAAKVLKRKSSGTLSQLYTTVQMEIVGAILVLDELIQKFCHYASINV